MTRKVKDVRVARARSVVRYLKKAYPTPKTELYYRTPFQLVAAVILSAQCTDKHVNSVTKTLWQKYKKVEDFAKVSEQAFAKDIARIPFYRNKAKAIVGAARRLREEYSGRVPKSVAELVALPGIGYKTANVILGELYDIWEGIPTDTHVKRFAHRLALSSHTDLTKISKDLESLIPKKDWKYVNNGLVLYGRYVCPARPHDCTAHPLTHIYPPALHIWPKTR